jgi:hypothetical protein
MTDDKSLDEMATDTRRARTTDAAGRAASPASLSGRCRWEFLTCRRFPTNNFVQAAPVAADGSFQAGLPLPPRTISVYFFFFFFLAVNQPRRTSKGEKFVF